MMRRAARILLVLLLALLVAASAQRRRRDPLNESETNQLRETSMDPDRKLKLYIKFARARLEAIEQLRSDPRFAEGRGPKIHDLLEDFKSIMDEMDDNLDAFARQKADLRKPLKDVIQADSEFQLKLRTLQEASKDAKMAAEVRAYSFMLQDSLDAVDGNLDDARALLAQQEKAAAEKKANKK